MDLSLYSATVPHFLRILPQVASLIQKAEDHCADATRYFLLGIENFGPRISTRRRQLV